MLPATLALEVKKQVLHYYLGQFSQFTFLRQSKLWRLFLLTWMKGCLKALG